jgi:hypothetical protein
MRAGTNNGKIMTDSLWLSQIHVAGNSGCKIQLQRRGDVVTVEKSASDQKYSPRLKVQIDKQRSFRNSRLAPFIRVPRVLNEREVDGTYTVEMEYICFHSSLEFFSSASRPAIDAVAEMLLKFVDMELAQSPIQDVPVALFCEKIASIADALQQRGVRAEYEECISRITNALTGRDVIKIPLGVCHGDLTFSNVMIASDFSAIALIDFLDSFVDSPIVDIAKIQQDTRFHWTKMFGVGMRNGTRFSQAMDYLDEKISEHFSALKWYSDNIDIVFFLNMLRIAPYATSIEVQKFILKSMESMRLNYD